MEATLPIGAIPLGTHDECEIYYHPQTGDASIKVQKTGEILRLSLYQKVAGAITVAQRRAAAYNHLVNSTK